MKIQNLLLLCVEKHASDLILTANTPPIIRKDGEVIRTDFEPLTPEKVQELVKSLLTPEQVKEFAQKKDLDLSMEIKGVSRFRINVYYQKGTMAAALRIVPLHVPTIEGLNLPPILKQLALLPRGLILVTGPAGSGKSSTLAAMIQFINSNKRCHIITIEDPIEYMHENDLSIVEQRELNIDTDSFADALKHVVRQSPDVILVGEMRDLDTISTAITAAETGHLVLATLHTIDAPQTVHRIIDVFPGNQQEQIRTQFAGSLAAIISQQLLPAAGGKGRVPAVEILINTPGIRSQIMHNDIQQIPLHIHTGRDKDYAGCVRSFRRPQTVETVRLTSGASQSCQRPRDYVRPRPTLARDATHGQDTALRREAAPVAEDSSNSPRDFVRARQQK